MKVYQDTNDRPRLSLISFVVYGDYRVEKTLDLPEGALRLLFHSLDACTPRRIEGGSEWRSAGGG